MFSIHLESSQKDSFMSQNLFPVFLLAGKQWHRSLHWIEVAPRDYINSIRHVLLLDFTTFHSGKENPSFTGNEASEWTFYSLSSLSLLWKLRRSIHVCSSACLPHAFLLQRFRRVVPGAGGGRGWWFFLRCILRLLIQRNFVFTILLFLQRN